MGTSEFNAAKREGGVEIPLQSLTGTFTSSTIYFEARFGQCRLNLSSLPCTVRLTFKTESGLFFNSLDWLSSTGTKLFCRSLGGTLVRTFRLPCCQHIWRFDMRSQSSHHFLSKDYQSRVLRVHFVVWSGRVLCSHVHVSRGSEIFSSPPFPSNRRGISWSGDWYVCVWTTHTTTTDLNRSTKHVS